MIEMYFRLISVILLNLRAKNREVAADIGTSPIGINHWVVDRINVITEDMSDDDEDSNKEDGFPDDCNV